MKFFVTLSFFYLFISLPWASAKSLSDYKPYKYEVLFTNPECREYFYQEAVYSNRGERLRGKRKDAYCKSSDSAVSAARPSSPHSRLVDWIRDPSTKEIFLAYLSFSKKSIADELCNAIKRRNLKVTLVYDSHNRGDIAREGVANMLASCRPSEEFSPRHFPQVIFSGSTGQGSNQTGFAHNKLIMVNPDAKGEVRIGFSSGNISSGTVTNHENWHFITTHSDSYFAQAHNCLRHGVLEHDGGVSQYSQFIKNCKRQIRAEEESDIKTFFVPGEGDDATQSILQALRYADLVEMATHRFSYSTLVNALVQKLKSGKGKVHFVAEDDVYWAGVHRREMGRNTPDEFQTVRRLEQAGMRTKYLETWAEAVFEAENMQLQHNKFLIFTSSNTAGAVFTGAGNLTGAAFSNNFENFYFITIPEVYQAYRVQYQRLWDELGRSYEDMPKELVLP